MENRGLGNTEIVTAAVVCAAVTAIFFRGMLWPPDVISEAGGDFALGLWNIWHMTESALALKNPFYADEIFFPVGTELARHSMALAVLPVTIAVRLLEGGAASYTVHAYHAAMYANWVLFPLFAYLIFREIGYARWISACAAMMFCYADFFIWHSTHLGFFGITLTVYGLIRFIRRPGPGNALLAASTAAYGFYATEFTVLILFAAFLAASATLATRGGRDLFRQTARCTGVTWLAVSSGLFLALISPKMILWFAIRGTAIVPYGDFVKWSANPLGYFIPDNFMTGLYGDTFSVWDEKIVSGIGPDELFLGYPLIVLAAFGLARIRKGIIALSFGMTAVFLILSLGPKLHAPAGVSDVFLPFEYLAAIPPFDMFRTPVRFCIVVLFSLAIISAEGMEVLAESVNRKSGSAASVGAALFAAGWIFAESMPPGISWYPFTPPVEKLSVIREGPVANLPFWVFDPFAVLMQIYHRQNISGGYKSREDKIASGYLFSLVAAQRNRPGDFCGLLKSMGYKSIIISHEASATERYYLRGCGLPVADFGESVLREYRSGMPVEWRADEHEINLAIFPGWSYPESGYRWSEGDTAKIILRLGGKSDGHTSEPSLRVTASAMGEQKVQISFNGIYSGDVEYSGPAEVTREIAIPANAIAYGAENTIKFTISNPRKAGNGDRRNLGIALVRLELDY